MTDQIALDLIEAFTAVDAIRFGDTSLDNILYTVAHLAKRTIPGAAEASVTLSRAGGNGAYTAAYTGVRALTLDETQYEQGCGPCLDAVASGDTLLLADMGSERRWPDFAAQALEAGYRSSLSIGLPVHRSAAGALNIYAAEPLVLDEDAVALAQTFAGYAAVALANAHLYDTQENLANRIRTAMDGRVARALVDPATR